MTSSKLVCRIVTRESFYHPTERRYILSSYQDLKTIMTIIEAEISPFVFTDLPSGGPKTSYLESKWISASLGSLQIIPVRHVSFSERTVEAISVVGIAASKAEADLIAHIYSYISTLSVPSSDSAMRSTCIAVSSYYLKVGRGDLPLLSNPRLLEDLVRAAAKGIDAPINLGAISPTDQAILKTLGFKMV